MCPVKILFQWQTSQNKCEVVNDKICWLLSDLAPRWKYKENRIILALDISPARFGCFPPSELLQQAALIMTQLGSSAHETVLTLADDAVSAASFLYC